MNNITSKSRFVRLFGLAALLVLAMAVVSPVGATDYETLEIGSDTTLTEDHYGNIVITADNVTLDCANHKITGDGYDSGILLSGRKGVTVKNCEISGFEFGILLTDSDENTLTQNTTIGNVHFGIFLYISADDNTINQNVTSNNVEIGIVVNQSDGNRLIENEAVGNDVGIALHWSHNNELKGNISTRNQAEGFSTYEATYNRYTENIAENNNIGFNLVASSNNTLSDSTANDNGLFGVFLFEQSNFNTVNQNTANNNGNHGIVVNESNGNDIRDNSADYNEMDGIDIYRSSSNTVVDNKAKRNGGNGFFVLGEWNTLKENTAMHNGGGFGLTDDAEAGIVSNNNRFELNHACQNEWSDGYDASAGINNTWLDNKFCTFYDANAF